MKFHEALTILATQDKEKGIFVFTRMELRALFADDSQPAFDSGLKNLVSKRLLIRATTNVYVYAHAIRSSGDCRELIAIALRPDVFNYVSLQAAMMRHAGETLNPDHPLTVMTTGRRGRFETPYGPIVFTHSHRDLDLLMENTESLPGHPLRYAKQAAAERDLRRANRRESESDEDLT